MMLLRFPAAPVASRFCDDVSRRASAPTRQFLMARRTLAGAVSEGPAGQYEGGRKGLARAPKEAEVDERGWWEKPEEKSMQAYALQPLEPWQAESLERAYASDGRRKMKVQALGAELGLDRVRIISWAKEFSQRPTQEREAILVSRRAEVEQERIKSEQRRVAEAAVNLQPHPEDQQGFIPFYTRKESGLLEGRKRMPAEVMRTLESIYARTPFPSDDVIKGVWELHRLNRETVLEWLKGRREVDGIVSSTQRRRERPRGGGSSLYIEGGDFIQDGAAAGPGPGSRGDRGGGGVEDDVLMSLMGDVAPKQEEQRPMQVVGMSRTEMAALRSSLPSRKKYKGRQLAEKMGIKTDDDEDANALQIGDLRFVEDAQVQQEVDAKWSKAWRYKRASTPSSIRRQ